MGTAHRFGGLGKRAVVGAMAAKFGVEERVGKKSVFLSACWASVGFAETGRLMWWAGSDVKSTLNG